MFYVWGWGEDGTEKSKKILRIHGLLLVLYTWTCLLLLEILGDNIRNMVNSNFWATEKWVAICKVRKYFYFSMSKASFNKDLISGFRKNNV